MPVGRSIAEAIPSRASGCVAHAGDAGVCDVGAPEQIVFAMDHGAPPPSAASPRDAAASLATIIEE